MDLVRLAYYPFLPEVPGVVREVGPDMGQVLTSGIYSGVRRRGLARVEGAMDDRQIPPVTITDERGALAEILSVPIARMLVTLVADRTLRRRYAEAEGARLEAVLKEDADSIPVAAEALGVQVVPHGDAWRIHMTDYLQVAPTHEAEWKLILRPVEQGWVPLSGLSVSRLCREALAKRIEEELEAEAKKPVHDEVRMALQPMLDELGPKLAEARENWQTGDFGPVRRELFPPCIVALFNDMKDGKMIPHHGRFAMASFLGTIGMTVQDVMDYFREIPNFDPEKSRYQIEHILGDRGVDGYTPPGCGWMQTNGVCPLEARDNLCFKIKHPLSYYRARLRFQKEDEEKAAKLIEHERRKKEALAKAGAANE